MTRLLKQKGSGHIYVWTPILADRPDMEPYEPPALHRVSDTQPVDLPVDPEPEPQPVESPVAEISAAEMAKAVLKRKTRK